MASISSTGQFIEHVLHLVSVPSMGIKVATVCASSCMLICAVFALTACALPINYRPHEQVFSLQIAYSKVTFSVLDRREEASKKFRKLDESPASFEYGDDQFHPSRVSVVASHFAAAFPRASAETPLIIEKFDVKDSITRPVGDQGFKGSGPSPAFERFIRGNLSPVRNYIICRIKGSFGDVHFEVTQHTNYDNPASKEHAQAVNGAMLAAITTAIEQVRERRPSSSR